MLTGFNSANRTLVPIHCRVVRDLSDFDGAWTVTVVLYVGNMLTSLITTYLSLDVGK